MVKKMIRNYIKSVSYLIIVANISLAIAGSYEDFFIAIRRNDAGSIAALLQRGFDPNTRDPNGQTGLILALHGENLAAAEALMASPELRVDSANPVGESALMMAALRGQTAWCKRLLERGAPVNKPGWSPLHYAATGPEPRIVQMLLERDAVVDADSPNRTTPLMMAARYGPEESVALLLARGADPKRTNELNWTAADYARAAGRESLAAKLSKAER